MGVLGYGRVGQQVCQAAVGLGFTTLAWRRTESVANSVTICAGDSGLRSVLSQCDYIINTLPLTEQTQGLIDYERLCRFKKNAWFINVGRGATVVEPDLLRALDQGGLAGAWLDVFEAEPLPPAHPFWDHPKVRLTPHIAGLTDPSDAAEQIIQSYNRVILGQPPAHLIDREKGY